MDNGDSRKIAFEIYWPLVLVCISTNLHVSWIMSILISLWLVIKRLEITKLDNVVWYFSMNYSFLSVFFIKKAATIEGERKKAESFHQKQYFNTLKKAPHYLLPVASVCKSTTLFVAFFSHLIVNSLDVFTNLFHQFFPQIFLSLRSWKRKQSSCWSKTVFFSHFASWKRNHNKYLLQKS